MSLNLTAGGYVVHNQGRRQLPVSNHPSIANVHELLDAVKDAYGVVKISDSNKPDIGIQGITLYAENRRYLIMLDEIDEGGRAKSGRW